jgi:paraquat-inducible protein A
LLLAFALPMSSVVLPTGRFALSDLFTGPALLEEQGAWVLSAAVLSTLMILPVVHFASPILMAVACAIGRVPTALRRLFARQEMLRMGAMVDVFVLGAMIALVRLRAWLDVRLELSLLALVGVVCCSLAKDAVFDAGAFWRRVPLRDREQASPGSTLIGCTGCGLVLRTSEGTRCPRCDGALHRRTPSSISRTLAWVVGAAIFVLPANMLPIMAVSKLGRGGEKTILGGTFELAERGFLGLALIVFVASILVPILKLATLSLLLHTAARGRTTGLRWRTRAFRFVARIGRWSMVDIFATATLVATARFGWFGSVLPEGGAAAFCAVVLLTMIAAETFDPRLMWDRAAELARASAASAAPRGAWT